MPEGDPALNRKAHRAPSRLAPVFGLKVLSPAAVFSIGRPVSAGDGVRSARFDLVGVRSPPDSLSINGNVWH